MLVQFCAFDGHYLERLRRGDVPTGEHFADYFGRLIRLKLTSRLLSKAAIEDIRQETLLRVWVALRKDQGIRQPERLGAFVSSVCNNVLREHRRRNKKEDQAKDDTVACLPDTAIQVPDIVASQESRRHVGRVLAKMPTKSRDLIQKVFFDECNKDEVCRELGVDRQYFRVLLHRAVRQFKQRYLEEMRAATRLHTTKHSSHVSLQASLPCSHAGFETSCSLALSSGKAPKVRKNKLHSHKPRAARNRHFPPLSQASSFATPEEPLRLRFPNSALFAVQPVDRFEFDTINGIQPAGE